MPEKKPKIDLNIYLVVQGKDNINDYIKKPQTLRTVTLDLAGRSKCQLFIRSPRTNLPKWAKFLSGHLDLNEFGHNASTGAVLSVQVSDRTMLISFGQGWHCINSSAVESYFGLKTALNIINPSTIRSIDKSSLEAQPKQLREQSGHATDVQYFGIDVERDLLRAVTGKPKEECYGSQVSGSDSFRMSIDITLEQLPAFLDKTLNAYQTEEYRRGPFSWIDHIGQVRDSALIESLNKELIQLINDRVLDKIWLSVPEIVDWNRIVGFRYSTGRRHPRVYDVRVLDLLKTFKDPVITKEALLRRTIYCVDADDNPVLERPAYNYLYAEITRDNHVYLLNNSNWYRIQQDYAERINDTFDRVTRYDKKLPIYDDATEGHYNNRVSSENPDEYVLLDKDLARIPGAASPIEICDLYRKVKEFIHVKRYGGSSVLSHLFNQGLVSGEIFQMDPSYRAIVDSKLPDDRKISDPVRKPAPREYRIVYAIISENDGDLTIPFFSKVTLKHCINRLEAMGFVVMLAKIDVKDSLKILEVYPPEPKKKL